MESLLTIPCTSCADRLQNENDEILDDKGKSELNDHQSSSSWLDVMKSCCGITPTDEEEDEALLMECRWIPVCGRM